MVSLGHIKIIVAIVWHNNINLNLCPLYKSKFDTYRLTSDIYRNLIGNKIVTTQM